LFRRSTGYGQQINNIRHDNHISTSMAKESGLPLDDKDDDGEWFQSAATRRRALWLGFKKANKQQRASIWTPLA
jgi:hypothetical protein